MSKVEDWCGENSSCLKAKTDLVLDADQSRAELIVTAFRRRFSKGYFQGSTRKASGDSSNTNLSLSIFVRISGQ